MSDELNKLAAALEELGADHSMLRCRPYDGQPWTDSGIRGSQEIKGITMRDLRDCFIRAVILAGYGIVPDIKYREAEKGENGCLCLNDLYGFDLDQLDPVAIAQVLTCEVEKIMGIFPNVPHAVSINDIPMIDVG